MAKTISLPEVIYKDLASISEELASVARKPFSPAMTVSLLIAVYRAHLNDPCARDAFRQRIATQDFMSPEDFERTWDASSPKKEEKREKE
jgi:hypothetical protein